MVHTRIITHFDIALLCTVNLFTPSSIFSACFPTKTSYTFLILPMFAPCFYHSNCLLKICINLFHTYIILQPLMKWGPRWRSWLRHCATSQKVAGSIPDGVIGIFHWHNSSGRTMRRADNLATFMCRLSWNLGTSTSWNPLGLFRPVMGLLYLQSLMKCVLHHIRFLFSSPYTWTRICQIVKRTIIWAVSILCFLRRNALSYRCKQQCLLGLTSLPLTF